MTVIRPGLVLHYPLSWPKPCPEVPSAGQGMCPEGCLFPICPKAGGGSGQVNSTLDFSSHMESQRHHSIYATVPTDPKQSFSHNQNFERK